MWYVICLLRVHVICDMHMWCVTVTVYVIWNVCVCAIGPMHKHTNTCLYITCVHMKWVCKFISHVTCEKHMKHTTIMISSVWYQVFVHHMWKTYETYNIWNEYVNSYHMCICVCISHILHIYIYILDCILHVYFSLHITCTRDIHISI